MTLLVPAIAALAASATPARADACKVGMVADLPVTMRGMRASVPVKVNGRDTEFWLDSGAWFSIMAKARADELGLQTEPAPQGLYGIGIGGTHRVEVVRIKDFGIVGQSLHNLEFLVGGSDTGNALIGRNILAIADTEFDLAHGSVKLFQAKGCDKLGMAYWAAGKPWLTAKMANTTMLHNFGVKVAINGVEIAAVIDSGAPTSLLSQRAAERAGIALDGPGVQPINGIGGFGHKLLKGWAVPVASVAIGEEQVLRTRLDVIEGTISGIDGPDMLLGADFLLAHRVYFARSQEKVYFTYNGGKPFHAGGSGGPDAAPAATAAPVALPAGTVRLEASDTSAEPKTADEFARRAAARLAAGQFEPALADYDAAIALTPDSPALYRDRAQAHARAGQPERARADFDKAIALAPNDPDLLRMRALHRLRENDAAGAMADADAAAHVSHPAALESRLIAEIYNQLGHAEKAAPLYDAMIAAHREDSHLPELYNGRCWSRGLAGLMLAAALDDCNRALKARPGKPGFLDSRGLVRFRMGDYAGALADYDAAIAAAPGLGWSHYMRGLTRIALGQVEAGKAERDAALADNRDVANLARFYKLER